MVSERLPRKGGAKRSGSEYARLADEAVATGLLPIASRQAALSLAGQITRLESRFERYYALGDGDDEALRLQSTPQALEMMGKCEKLLAELKARFFEFTGLDRQAAAKARLAELQCGAAEKGGEVVLKLEGFGEPPGQEEG